MSESIVLPVHVHSFAPNSGFLSPSFHKLLMCKWEKETEKAEAHVLSLWLCCLLIFTVPFHLHAIYTMSTCWGRCLQFFVMHCVGKIHYKVKHFPNRNHVANRIISGFKFILANVFQLMAMKPSYICVWQISYHLNILLNQILTVSFFQ